MKRVKKTFKVNGRKVTRDVWEMEYPEQFWPIERADSEQETVECIKAHLLTPEQTDLLRAWNLDVADLLNGRYPVNIEDEVHEKFYHQWNKVIGHKCFSEKPIGKEMLKAIEGTLNSEI